MGVFQKLFDIRREEFPRFSLLFFAFFIYNVGVSWASSSTRSVIVAQPELGSDFIATGLVFFGITTILASIVYTAVVDRIPKQLLLVIMTAISAAAVASGIVAFALGLKVAGAVALYVLYESILLIWVLQWKTNIIDFYDTRTSKRILPLLGVARLIGLAVGGFSYALLTDTLGLEAQQIFWLWFATLIIVLVIVWLMPRILNDPKPQSTAAEGGYLDSIRDGFTYIGNSRYLKWMTGSAILMNAQIALFTFVAIKLVGDYYDLQLPGDTLAQEAAIGKFFGALDGYSALIMLFVQLFFFPQIMKRLGLGNVNLIYPITAFGVAGTVAFAFAAPVGILTIGSAAAAHITIKSFRRVFRSPINGLLINAVPSFMKGRSRSVINGVISPFANIVIGLAVQIDSIPLPNGNEISSTNIFTILAVLVSVAYAYTGFVLKREYGRAMVKLLKREDYAALLSQDYEWGAVDTHTLSQLRQRLSETEDVDFIHFLATIMLEVGSTDAAPMLIAHARDIGGETKRTIMNVLVEGDARGDPARFFYIENTDNPDPLTRRAALTGLMNIMGADEEIRFKIAIDHAHDSDAIVRAQSIKTLMQSNTIAHKDRAERVLRAMQSDYHAETRVAAINAMVDMGDVEYIRKLVLFMDDEDDNVRLATTVGIERLWQDNMPQDITQLILDREKMLLDDPIERIRRAELRVLGKIANDSAASTLIRALVDESPEIRRAAMDALAGFGNSAIKPLLKASQTENRQLAKQAMIVLTRINHDRYDDDLIRMAHETLDEIYANHAILQVLDDCNMYPSFGVLAVHFVEQNRLLRAEIFDMLRMVYDATAVNTIHETLQSENPRTRINAVEALESLATPELARQMAPLFEPNLTSEALAQGFYDRQKQEPKSTEAILRELATGADTWLRAVSVMALGEVAADNNNIRRVILGDDTIPRAKTGQLSPCQKHINPDITAVTVRTALSSKNLDVRRTARAAMRLIRGETIFDTLAQLEDKESPTVLSIIERMIYLKRVAFFQSLSVEQLKALATICDEKVLKKSQQIFKEGDDGGALYIVVTGRVEVGLMNKEQDTFTMLAAYEANTAFGEMSLFDSQPRSADAKATEDTLTLTVSREPFLALTRQYPDLSVHLITTLSDRLRHANEQIARLNNTMRETIDV